MEFIPPAHSPWSNDLLTTVDDVKRWWLQKPNALTDGLRALGKLQLQVLNEQACVADASEAWMVGDESARPQLWIREIVMSLDGTPVVAARSLCDISASLDQWAAMRGLSNRPLADLLYTDEQISRSAFCHIDAAHNAHLHHLCQVAFNLNEVAESTYLVRASKFSRVGQALIVMECFTPAFWSKFARILG